MLGKNALNESAPAGEQTFRVEQIIIHEDFNNREQNYNNDIGMNGPIHYKKNSEIKAT